MGVRIVAMMITVMTTAPQLLVMRTMGMTTVMKIGVRILPMMMTVMRVAPRIVAKRMT